MMYLDYKGPEYDGAEDQVIKDALKNISFAMDLSSVNFVKELHHHKCVKEDGVVL